MTVNDYAAFSDIQATFSNLDLTGNATNGMSYSMIFAPLINRASRSIDRLTARKPGAYAVTADVTLTFAGPATGYSIADGVYHDDRLSAGDSAFAKLWIEELAATPTSINVAMTGDSTVWTSIPATNAAGKPNWFLWPYNALDSYEPFRRIDLNILYGDFRTWYGFPYSIQIVGKFGYSQVAPPDIQMSVIIQAGRWFKRGQMGFQDRVSLDNGGNLISAMDRLDMDIEKSLMNYRRQAI